MHDYACATAGHALPKTRPGRLTAPGPCGPRRCWSIVVALTNPLVELARWLRPNLAAARPRSIPSPSSSGIARPHRMPGSWSNAPDIGAVELLIRDPGQVAVLLVWPPASARAVAAAARGRSPAMVDGRGPAVSASRPLAAVAGIHCNIAVIVEPDHEFGVIAVALASDRRCRIIVAPETALAVGARPGRERQRCCAGRRSAGSDPVRPLGAGRGHPRGAVGRDRPGSPPQRHRASAR